MAGITRVIIFLASSMQKYLAFVYKVYRDLTQMFQLHEYPTNKPYYLGVTKFRDTKEQFQSK